MASTIRTLHGATTPDPETAREAPARGSGVLLTELLLLGMAVIWGVNFTVVKYATRVFVPDVFNVLRVALAAGALLLVARATGRRWPARAVTWRLLALGTFGNGLYQLLFVAGVARTRASDAALVIAATPVFVAIIGRLRGTERLSRRGIVGVLLSVLGIALVVLGGSRAARGEATLLGGTLVLGAALCWSTYTVLLQPLTGDVDGLTLAGITMLGGVPPLLLAAAAPIARTHWGAVPLSGWGAVLYSGLLSLTVAYVFWYRGLRVIGPTRTAMFGNLQPVIALLVAWAALGETPRAPQLLGAVAIFGGLLLGRRAGVAAA